MKEFDELTKTLQATRKAIKKVKPRAVMAATFDSQQDLVNTIRAMQKAACDTARDAQQLCDDLTDILVQLEPP